MEVINPEVDTVVNVIRITIVTIKDSETITEDEIIETIKLDVQRKRRNQQWVQLQLFL